MAGILVVLMGLVSIMIPAVLLLGYLLDSGFVSSVLYWSGQRRVWGWIPFYGQLLLGRIAGMPRMGIALMVSHLVSAGLAVLVFLIPELEVYEILFPLFFAAVATGILIKEWVVHRIFAKAAGKWSILLTAADVMTLGFTRSIFLFALRKRVNLPTRDAAE